jgi:drug/metabolite transporter (DMT)-like permease
MTALGVFMLAEKLTAVRAIALLLGLIGTVLISANDLSRASFNKQALMGNLIIFLAGLGSAFYNTYSKSVLSPVHRVAATPVQLHGGRGSLWPDFCTS